MFLDAILGRKIFAAKIVKKVEMPKLIAKMSKEKGVVWDYFATFASNFKTN